MNLTQYTPESAARNALLKDLASINARLAALEAAKAPEIVEKPAKKAAAKKEGKKK